MRIHTCSAGWLVSCSASGTVVTTPVWRGSSVTGTLPRIHSGLPQIDLSVHSDVLILAEDLKRRVLAVPCNPTPADEAHRRKLVRQLGRACGASATGLIGYRNQVKREMEARKRLADYDAAITASTTRIVLGSSAIDACILQCSLNVLFFWFIRVIVWCAFPSRGSVPVILPVMWPLQR